jgi:hypothetical protein
MNNLEKYNKYKLKYLQLKNQMIGGKPYGPSRKVDTLITLANDGSRPQEKELCQQCIWISIRDFLEYHRGIDTTVRALKDSVKLGKQTDRSEFDHYFKANSDNTLYTGLIQLCKDLSITICLISISSKKTVFPGSISDGRLANHDRISHAPMDPSMKEVYVAMFGGHFELIIEGPGYRLEPFNETRKPKLQATPYEPKVKVSATCDSAFVPVDELSPAELRLASYQFELIDMKQELAFFTTELKRVESDLVIYRKAYTEIKKIEGINDKSKEFLNKSHDDMIKELSAQQTHIITQIYRLEALIKTIEKELKDKMRDEQGKATQTIKTNKGLIVVLKEDLKRLEQNIVDLNDSNASIESSGSTIFELTPEQIAQFTKSSKDSIAKYNIDIAKITAQIAQLEYENENLQLLVNSIN